MADLLSLARARALAGGTGIPFVDLDDVPLDADLVAMLPGELLIRLGAVPYELRDGTLRVAVARPEQGIAGELEQWTEHRVELAVAADDEIELRLHGAGVADHLGLDSFDLSSAVEDDAPAVQRVSAVLARAADLRASDIHFLPDQGGLRVRVRVDGVMHEIGEVPETWAAAVVSRLKVLAKLDIAERRRPQDGRFSAHSSRGRTFDVRVAVLPTIAGEGVVLRLLEKSHVAPSLSDLGLSNAMQMQLERIVSRSTGALIASGPTGSGKSTSLYAALSDLARPEVNVITIEDPVEYELPGAYQIQVNAAAGTSFATALRAILRGDPDVIMVGEIRDSETANLALSASLAGHFVLTTLHTNDAPGAVTRLIDMGVEPYAVASGVTAVIAQRLVRRLCSHCREPFSPGGDVLAALGYPSERIAQGVRFHRAIGCPHCHAGYRGRVGVFELLTSTEQIRRLAAAGGSQRELERGANTGAGSSLWADGLAKVESGLTSLDELYRVLA